MTTIVWFHRVTEYNLAETEKDTQYEKQLTDNFPQLCIFDDANICVDYISNCASNTVYVILSDVQGLQALSLVYQLEQLVFIYILEYKSLIEHTKDNLFIKNCSIGRGPFKNLSKLITQLQYDTISSEKNTTFINNPFNLLVSQLNTIDNIDERQNERLRFQVILAAFLRSHNTHSSTDFIRQMMIDECRQQYATDAIELKKIDEFERNESKWSTIQWWSQDSFIYRLINKALRSRNWSSIIKYQYFLVKLHNELDKLHREQYSVIHTDENRDKNKSTVYRGQSLFIHDLDVLKNNIGGLVSINYFLATTKDKIIASVFAYESEKEEIVAVVFKILIDIRISSAVFADISLLSVIQDEQEILLSMGTIFRVEKVDYDSTSHRWNVSLILTNPDDDPLLSFMLSESQDMNLGQVLYKMGEYETARDYCQSMLQNTNDPRLYYCILGNIFKEMKEYERALENHYNALNLVTSIYQCSSIYYNIGLAYLGKGDCNRALRYYREASELECVEGDTANLAEIYHDMGLAYIGVGALRLGVNYLERALAIQKCVLPSNHYHLGYTYMNLGDFYRDCNENNQALEYYQHALDIYRCSRRHDDQTTTIPAHISIYKLYIDMNQPDMARRTFEQLANTYGSMGKGTSLATMYMNIIRSVLIPRKDFIQSVTYTEYVLSIREQNLAADHVLIGMTLYFLGTLQLAAHLQSGSQNPFVSLAASRANLERAVEIVRHHPNYLTMALQNLAFIYRALKEYSQSIDYFKQSLENSLPGDSHLPMRHKNLACAYGDTHQFKNGIKHLKYAINLYSHSNIGIADPDVIKCHTLIGIFYKFTKRYNLALTHLSKALYLWRMTADPSDADDVVGAIYYHTADIYHKLNFEDLSHIAQLFYFWNMRRFEQLHPNRKNKLTSTDPYFGYVNGFTIHLTMMNE